MQLVPQHPSVRVVLLAALLLPACDLPSPDFFGAQDERINECFAPPDEPLCEVSRATFARDGGYTCSTTENTCPRGTTCVAVDGGTAGTCIVPSCGACQWSCPPGYECDVAASTCVPLQCDDDEACGRVARCLDGCCQPDEENPELFPFSEEVCTQQVLASPCRDACMGGCDFERCGCSPNAADPGCDAAFTCFQVDDDTPERLGVCIAKECHSASADCGPGAVCNWEQGLCMPRACDDAADCGEAVCVDGCCARN